VLTGRTSGPYRCAPYAGAKGDRAGWVRQDRLHSLPMPVTSSVHAWTGHWDYFDNTINLTRQGDVLAIDGEAYWPAANPGAGRLPHIGDIAGRAVPRGNRATFAIGAGAAACKVQLVLLGNQLLVSDNANCGGNNVRFNGVYEKG